MNPFAKNIKLEVKKHLPRSPYAGGIFFIHKFPSHRLSTYTGNKRCHTSAPFASYWSWLSAAT